MNNSNLIIVFMLSILSYWTTPVLSQACIGDFNIAVTEDCDFSMASKNISGKTLVKVVVGDVTKNGSGTDFSTGEGTGLMPGHCYLYEFHYTDGTWCWGNVCLVATIIPDFTADCIYTPASHSSRTVKVIPDGDIYDDKDDDGEKDPGEELNDLMLLASVTVDSSCQKLSFEILNSVKHISIEDIDIVESYEWQYDSICWWIYENIVDGVVIDSGKTTSNVITSGFGTGSYSVSTDSTYLLVVSVKESENMPSFITEDGTRGTITGGLWLSDCVPDCFTWCPSVRIATEKGNKDPLVTGILDIDAVQELIDAKPCFAGITNLTEERIITGAICTPQNVINPSDQSAGQLMRIIHSATFPGIHGEPGMKRIILEQAYVIGQPEMSPPFSNVIKDPPKLSCGDDVSPWGIYEVLLARNLKLVKPTDDATTVFQYYKDAAQNAFPHIVNIHDSIEVEITFPGDPITIVVEELKEIKVLKYLNTLTSELFSSSYECPQPDSINNISCKPIWVKQTIVEKTSKEIPHAITKKKWKIPSIHTFYEKGLCGFTSAYSDLIHPPPCGGGQILTREWSMINYCSGFTGGEVEQTIVIEDNVPPVIDEYADITLNVNPWTCSVTLNLDEDFGTDECSVITSRSWSADRGADIKDNQITIWLSEGRVIVTGTVNDDCGNHATTSFKIHVEDRNPPIAIAKNSVNVSLTGDPTINEDDPGTAKVFVDGIDAGSHNSGCGEIELCLLLKEELANPIIIDGIHATVVLPGIGPVPIYHAAGCQYDGILKGIPETKLDPGRPDYPYVYCKDFVKFCCEDIGENQVALVVTNEMGYASHSWTTVIVEDKSQTVYSCHSDVILPCDKAYDPYDYAPTFQSTVCYVSNLEYTIAGDNDACGDGLEIITWILDGKVICTTEIELEGESNFNPYEIKWPKHYTGDEVEGVIRECELWLEYDSTTGKDIPVLDKDGNEQYRIVEYFDAIPMGTSFDCEQGDNTSQPSWCQATCALVGSSFETLEVEATDACKKIIRRWTIIDWCKWDPNTANPDDDIDAAYDQFMAVDDEWLDEYDPAHAGQWYTDYRVGFELDGDGNAILNRPDDKGFVTGWSCSWCDKQSDQADPIYFRYSKVDVDGYYTFDQVIKVIDETDPVIDAPETLKVSIIQGAQSKTDDYVDCNADEDITAAVTDMCGDMDLSADGAAWWIEVWASNADGDKVGNEPLKTKTAFGTSATMNTQVGTHGDYHLIYWTVRDGCGNIGGAYTLVNFEDDKQPTPICLQDLSTAVMPTSGTVKILAADYDNGSFDNCSEVDVEFRDEDGNGVASLTFDCDDITNGVSRTFEIMLWVIDAAGNEDYCFVTLRVDDNDDQCSDVLVGASARISGEIFTNGGTMIEKAQVTLNRSYTDMTSTDGQYAFNNNALNQDYELAPAKNDDFLYGVTSLDLVMIEKYLIGVGDLDQNAYNVIAADVNGNGSISASDVIELRNLILNNYDELPNNTSWRFVDAAQSFADFNNPFPFKEYIDIDNLNGNSSDNNFVGVKIGDVSDSAIANSSQAGARSKVAVNLEVEDAVVEPGEIISVDFKTSDLDGITAFQGTFSLNGLEFLGVNSGVVEMTEGNFNLLDANTLTIAWYGENSVWTSEELFSIDFRANTGLVLSEALKFNSNVTSALAYDASYNEFDLGLTLNTGEVLAGFELYQNEPNPFVQSTLITFKIPEAAHVQLTMFDVTGKVVSIIDGDFNKGLNNFSVTKSDLNASGILYYQVQSGDFSATRKMIFLE